LSLAISVTVVNSLQMRSLYEINSIYAPN